MNEQNNENRLKSPFHKLITGNLSIQIIVTVFAAVIYTVLVNAIENRTIAAVITSVVTIPAYVAMIYTFLWGVGERERNMVLYGHMSEDKSRGLRSGAYAALPIAIYAVVASVLTYVGGADNVVAVFKIAASPFILLVEALIEYAPYGLISVAIFSILPAWCGYRNGYSIYRIWDHLIYKNGVRPDNKKRRAKKMR